MKFFEDIYTYQYLCLNTHAYKVKIGITQWKQDELSMIVLEWILVMRKFLSFENLRLYTDKANNADQKNIKVNVILKTKGFLQFSKR